MGGVRTSSRLHPSRLTKNDLTFFASHPSSIGLYGGWKWSKRTKSKSRTKHHPAWRKKRTKKTRKQKKSTRMRKIRSNRSKSNTKGKSRQRT